MEGEPITEGLLNLMELGVIWRRYFDQQNSLSKHKSGQKIIAKNTFFTFRNWNHLVYYVALNPHCVRNHFSLTGDEIRRRADWLFLAGSHDADLSYIHRNGITSELWMVKKIDFDYFEIGSMNITFHMIKGDHEGNSFSAS